MIYDFKKLRSDYAIAYMDKSRIKFIESYLSTFNATKGKKTQFHCFPRQRAFLKALAENRNVVAIKPRQCGITTLSSAWVTGQCVFASKDAPETVLCIANKLEQAQEIIIKIRDFLEQVPRWMWGNDYFSPDPNSEKNTKSIFLKDAKGELKLFNGCRIIARASGPNASRGISAVSVLILDEAAFIEDGVSVFATATATMASNPNSKTIMVSTPNGMDALYYNTYRQALAHENNFTAVQFRWYQDPRFNKFLTWKKKNDETGDWLYDQDPIVDDEGNIEYNEERWANLERKGWKPCAPWYEEMCKSFNNDTMKIAQELDVSFMGSSDNVVAPEFIEMQEMLNVREPLEDFVDPLVEETWFWKKPIEGHRYILACLPKGEKVLTQRGLVNIEDVTYDDSLVTKEGDYTKIKNIMTRDVENEEIIEIKPYDFIDGVKFTHNHPIWSSLDSKVKWESNENGRFRKLIHEFKFNDAKDVTANAWLELPNIYRLNGLSEKELSEKWKPFEKTFNNQHEPLNNPLLNEEFWWYCGMWLAEGFTHDGDVVTVHNIDEIDYHSRIVSLCKNVLHRNAVLTPRNSEHSLRISISSVQLSDFLSDTFGKYADGKGLQEWVKFIPERFKLKLLNGYFDGDGCYQNRVISAASVSKKLLCDLQDILLSLGISSSMVKKYDKHNEVWGDKHTFKKTEYVLTLNNTSRIALLRMFGLNIEDNMTKKVRNSFINFSEDLSKIYVKVKDVAKKIDSCKVYNFETVSDSHTFCCRGIATHNCDPSRGTAFDKTGIEIIDMDGQDENGLPIIEQVAEYRGKKLGDDIGALCYQYAMMYNNAFVVVDATGGSGDAAILTMLQLGYKNLYYEDMSQKTYMIQRLTKTYDGYTDKLPGFHFQGNRYPVLSNFAGLVRNNEFKIRSARVINELNTWIFKGENARMDHMDGANDDLICALAMGLFVMQYTVNRIQNTVNKDKAILNAYMMTGSFNTKRSKLNYGKTIEPKNGLPFYTQKSFPKNNIVNGNFMWVFGQWQ